MKKLYILSKMYHFQGWENIKPQNCVGGFQDFFQITLVEIGVFEILNTKNISAISARTLIIITGPK